MQPKGRLLLLALLSGPALAEAPPAATSLPQDRIYGRIGALAAGADTNVRIDVPVLGISGTLLDFESDFGLGRNQWVAAGEIGWRFSPEWRVEFAF